MKYLVDSDQIIWYLKGKEEVVKRLQEFQGELAVCVISIAEVAEGIFGGKMQEEKRVGLENFLTGVEILEIGEKIAWEFAQARSDLREKGQLIDNFDLLIAATCRYHNLTLITDNKKDFLRIKNLKII